MWWVVIAIVAWVVLSVVAALVIGRFMRVADREEQLVEFQRELRESSESKEL